VPGLRIPGGDRNRLACVGDAGHFDAELDLPTGSADDVRHRFADARVVDAACRRYEQGPDAAHVGLQLAEFGAGQTNGLDAVTSGALLEVGHPLGVLGPGGHEQLSLHSYRDPVLLAEVLRRLCALLAQLGLETPRCIVDARMNDATVVAGLMAGELGLLLEDHQTDTRPSFEEAHCGRHPDDAAADHAIVESHGHPACLTSE
jgi:hypothetical protein